jgi:hypothetical protein
LKAAPDPAWFVTQDVAVLLAGRDEQEHLALALSQVLGADQQQSLHCRLLRRNANATHQRMNALAPVVPRDQPSLNGESSKFGYGR